MLAKIKFLYVRHVLLIIISAGSLKFGLILFQV